MNYASIRQMDVANGPGIRVSMFVSGCNFHCPDCFNQEAQDFNCGKLYTVNTESHLLEYIAKPHVEGLSILGGDPLWQDLVGLAQLIELCDKVHKIPSKNVWLWTGFTWEQIWDKSKNTQEDISRRLLVSCCDVVVDGLYDKNLKDHSLKWKGSSNQRAIDVVKSHSANEVVLYE